MAGVTTSWMMKLECICVHQHLRRISLPKPQYKATKLHNKVTECVDWQTQNSTTIAEVVCWTPSMYTIYDECLQLNPKYTDKFNQWTFHSYFHAHGVNLKQYVFVCWTTYTLNEEFHTCKWWLLLLWCGTSVLTQCLRHHESESEGEQKSTKCKQFCWQN